MKYKTVFILTLFSAIYFSLCPSGWPLAPASDSVVSNRVVGMVTNPPRPKSEKLYPQCEIPAQLREILSRFKKTGVVIMAGGKGTRLQANVCKPLIQVGDKSIYEWILQTLNEIGVSNVMTVLPNHNPEWANQIRSVDVFRYQFEIDFVTGCSEKNSSFMDSAILACRKLQEKGITQTLLLMGDGVPDASLLAKTLLGRSNRCLILSEGGGEYDITLQNRHQENKSHLRGDLARLEIHSRDSKYASPVGWFFPTSLAASVRNSYEIPAGAQPIYNIEDLMKTENFTGWQVRLGRFEWINANTTAEVKALSKIMTESYWKDGIVTGGAYPDDFIELVFQSLNLRTPHFQLIQERLENSIYKSVDNRYYLKIFSQTEEGRRRYRREKEYHWYYNPQPPKIVYCADDLGVLIAENVSHGKNLSSVHFADVHELLLGMDQSKSRLPGDYRILCEKAFRAIVEFLHDFSQIHCTSQGWVEHNDIIFPGSTPAEYWIKEAKKYLLLLGKTNPLPIDSTELNRFSAVLSKQRPVVCHGDFNARNIILQIETPGSTLAPNVKLAGVIDGEWFGAFPQEKDIACFLTSLANEIYLRYRNEKGAPQRIAAHIEIIWSLFLDQYISVYGEKASQDLSESLPFWLGLHFLMKADEYAFFKKDTAQAHFHIAMARHFFRLNAFSIKPLHVPAIAEAPFSQFKGPLKAASFVPINLKIEKNKRPVTFRMMDYSIPTSQHLPLPLICYEHYLDDQVPLEDPPSSYFLTDPDGDILAEIQGYPLSDKEFYISYARVRSSDEPEELFKILLIQVGKVLAQNGFNQVSRVLLPEDTPQAKELFEQLAFNSKMVFDRKQNLFLYSFNLDDLDALEGKELRSCLPIFPANPSPLNVIWCGKPWPVESADITLDTSQKLAFYFSVQFTRPLQDLDLRNIRVEFFSNLTNDWEGSSMTVIDQDPMKQTYRFMTLVHADHSFSYKYRVSVDGGATWEWFPNGARKNLEVTVKRGPERELPKIILFDLDNVLFQCRSNRFWDTAAAKLAAQYQAPLDGKTLQEIIYTPEEKITFYEGSLDVSAYMKRINVFFKSRGSKTELSFPDFMDSLFQSHVGSPLSYQILKELHCRGIRLGIVSDRMKGDENTWIRLLNQYYPKLFDPALIFFSSQIGMSKESKKLLPHVLMTLARANPELKPDDILFVDDMRKHIVQALNLSMQAELFYLPIDGSLSRIPEVLHIMMRLRPIYLEIEERLKKEMAATSHSVEKSI